MITSVIKVILLKINPQKWDNKNTFRSLAMPWSKFF